MTAPEDEKLEANIPCLLLSGPGAARTMPELIRLLEVRRDDVNRALCSLADHELVRSKEHRLESLRPSLAASRCRGLLEVAAQAA